VCSVACIRLKVVICEEAIKQIKIVQSLPGNTGSVPIFPKKIGQHEGVKQGHRWSSEGYGKSLFSP